MSKRYSIARLKWLLLIWTQMAPAAPFARTSPRICTELNIKVQVQDSVRPLRSWNDLPAVVNAQLPAGLAARINAHPLAQAIRERSKNGEGVRFVADPRANYGGWVIQTRFLTKIIRLILPAADVASGGPGEGRLPLRLTDSTLETSAPVNFFDMSDLKILNAGPPLSDQGSLRAMLGLPLNERIVSVYHALKKSVDGKEIVREIFADPSVRIVVLSAQAADAQYDRLAWHDDIPLITSSEWVATPAHRRPARAIIFNETRQRLPYIHAAADEVVVIGAANLFESIYAGRPTYFDRYGEHGPDKDGWRRLVDVATRSGLGFSFDSAETLRHQLESNRARGPHRFAPGVTNDDQKGAIDRILRTLDHALPAR